MTTFFLNKNCNFKDPFYADLINMAVFKNVENLHAS